MRNEKRNKPLNQRPRPRSTKNRAKKSLGQNFLVDETVIAQIVQALGPRKGETIIEIGPGEGALTARLIETGSRIIAIELDRDLVPLLRREFGSNENFILIEGDAVAADLCAAIAPASTARLVANLPYNISTVIVQRLLQQCGCLSELILMLQREVASRISAPPSTSDRGYLSVLVEAYAEVEKLFDVAPTAFRPSPKVWSTVVRIKPRQQISVDIKNEGLFWRLVSAGFAQRRKTIFNNLRNAGSQVQIGSSEELAVGRLLDASGIESMRRAESLTLEEWARLSNSFEVNRS